MREIPSKSHITLKEDKMDKEVEDKITHLEKRIDDIKSFITLIVSAGTTIIGILMIVFTWSATSEKSDLRSHKESLTKEIKEELGKRNKKADIELVTKDGKKLDGQVVIANVKTYRYSETINDKRVDKTGILIELPFVIKNSGEGYSGRMTIKYYVKSPIKLTYSSTDEGGFDYEEYIAARDTALPNFPGGLTYEYPFIIYPKDFSKPLIGKHNILIKIYYGQGKQTSAHIVANIEKWPELSKKIQE